MRHRRKWTREEDQILRREASLQMEKGGQLKQWNVVAANLPERTNKDCRKRWAKLGSNINKGVWSNEEDEKLRAAVQDLGYRWTEVAKRVITRHAEQCAKRWQNSLDPTVDHTKWEEDDDKLIECVQLCGRNWTTIREKYFPNRSGTDLKNRFTMLTRKQRRAAEPKDISQDIEDGAEDDDNDESDEEDTSDNDNNSDLYPAESQALVAPILFSESSNQSGMFPYQDTMQDLNSAFFLPGDTAANDLAWDIPMDMSDYIPNHSHFIESEGSSSVRRTTSSIEDTNQFDIDISESRRGFGGLLLSESDVSEFVTRHEPSHSTPSPSPSRSQTTLILENVNPAALKSVISILIETNTKMTMQRHQ